MFMIRCKYYKKPIICGNISLVKVLWAKSNWLHISHWIQSSHFSVSSIQKILQILQVVPSSSSTVLSSFNDSVKLLHCCDGTGYCSSWSISLLTTVSNGTFFPLPLSPQNLLVLFCCNTLPPPPKICWSYFAVTVYECLVQWGIWAFLWYCSQEFSQNFFAIRWAIVTVKRITVKVE